MRLYTIAEARALLPQVLPVLESMREAFLALRALNASLATEARGASGDGNLLANPWWDGHPEDRVANLNAKLRQAIQQLEGWGIEVKDPERGLIDFYSERQGEVVFLCYMLGEPGIRYWHSLRAGFAGREPL